MANRPRPYAARLTEACRSSHCTFFPEIIPALQMLAYKLSIIPKSMVFSIKKI
jgi:hypothetical protein